MAGKATIHSLEYEDDDVEASAATGIGDGHEEHIYYVLMAYCLCQIDDFLPLLNLW